MLSKIYKTFKFNLEKVAMDFYCNFHFLNQVKHYCKELKIKKISPTYKRQIIKYWKQFNVKPNTIYFNWYSSRNGIFDPRYIPENLFYSKIEKYFNNMDMLPAYTDKAIFKRLFNDVAQPEIIISNSNGFYYDSEFNLISLDKAINLVEGQNEIFVKPTIESGGGKNANLIKSESGSSIQAIDIFHDYKQNFIIQKPIKQHQDLSKFHENSVNTIRITSFAFNNEILILSAILRVGVGDSFLDNECSGGINFGVNENGTVFGPAYDRSGKIHDNYSKNGLLSNSSIPSYDKIIATIKKIHKKLPYFKIVSWDFSVDVEGKPILIEYNLNWCGLNFHQLHNGPLFGKYTDIVLGEVFKKRK